MYIVFAFKSIHTTNFSLPPHVIDLDSMYVNVKHNCVYTEIQHQQKVPVLYIVIYTLKMVKTGWTEKN